jgi:hypothetical protein
MSQHVRPLREWYSLTPPPGKPAGGVWFVQAQVHLSYLLQAIELPPVFSPLKPVKGFSKLKRAVTQPAVTATYSPLNGRTNNSSSMLDLFGPTSTTSFSSSIPQYDVLSHSRSQLNFPTISDSLFGPTTSKPKEKARYVTKSEFSKSFSRSTATQLSFIEAALKGGKTKRRMLSRRTDFMHLCAL